MFGPIFISAVTFWGLALGGGFYWTRRYVRAIERQSAERAQIAALEARILALESERASTAQLGSGTSPGAHLRDRVSGS